MSKKQLYSRLENLLTNYYTKTEFIPDEIYLESELENIPVLKEWLEKKKNDKVNFVIPIIGNL